MLEPKSQIIMFPSVKNVIHLLFQLGQITAILDLTHNAMSKVFSGQTIMLAYLNTL